MIDADVYTLTRINWQLFGTLTFRSERLPNEVRRSMWFAHVRKTCKNYGIDFSKSFWCLRQEDGETTGRRHFHYLFGSLPERSVSYSTCFSLMSYWSEYLQQCKTHQRVWCRQCLAGEASGQKIKWVEKLNPAKNVGGGMARIRIFNSSLNGVGYVAKCLGLAASVGADLYEMNKFGLETSEVTLSKGAQAMLARGIREERRRIQRTEKWTEEQIKARSAEATVCVPPKRSDRVTEADRFLARGEVSSTAFKLNRGNHYLFDHLVEASGVKAALRSSL